MCLKDYFCAIQLKRKGSWKVAGPFWGVDGCFLKGPFKGVLLSAISIDANNGIFPIAIAIVDVESIPSWRFFLYYLHECIGGGTEELPHTFMSDRHVVHYHYLI